MSIEIINNKQLWDDFVDSSLNGTLFHKWDFLNIIEKHSGQKLLPYAMYRGDELQAVFPLFFEKKAVLNIVMSPPFSYTPYLGPVITSGYVDLKQDKKEYMMGHITEDLGDEITKYSPNYTMFKTTPGFFDIRPFIWEGYTANPSYTYIIDLNHTLEDIWNSFKKHCRKNIKEAEGNVFVKKCLNVSELSTMIKSRYEEQGINAPASVSSLYLADITERFKENLDLYCIYDKDHTNISSILIAKHRERYMTWIGGAKADIRGANESLEWELIKIAKSEGYKEFEEHGANTKNLCEYKSKFNPHLEMGFDVSKKSFLGKFGEWCYFNIASKRWY